MIVTNVTQPLMGLVLVWVSLLQLNLRESFHRVKALRVFTTSTGLCLNGSLTRGQTFLSHLIPMPNQILKLGEP